MELFSRHISYFWDQAEKKAMDWRDFTSIVKRNADFISNQDVFWLVEKSSKVNSDIFCCEECRIALLDVLQTLAVECPSQKRTFIKAMKNTNHSSVDKRIKSMKILPAFR